MRETDKSLAGTGRSGRANLPELVAERLRQAIYSGQLAPGSEINQVALARDFQVSRIPLREALRLLEAEGLVEAQAHRKTRVSRLPLHTLGELFDIREALESLAAVEAVAHYSLAHHQTVQHWLAEAEKPHVDHETWLTLNREFHAALYAAAGRPYLNGLIQTVQRNIGRYMGLYGPALNRRDQAMEEHRQIAEAFHARDAARARALVIMHIRNTQTALTKVLGSLATAAQASPFS